MAKPAHGGDFGNLSEFERGLLSDIRAIEEDLDDFSKSRGETPKNHTTDRIVANGDEPNNTDHSVANGVAGGGKNTEYVVANGERKNGEALRDKEDADKKTLKIGRYADEKTRKIVFDTIRKALKGYPDPIVLKMARGPTKFQGHPAITTAAKMYITYFDDDHLENIRRDRDNNYERLQEPGNWVDILTADFAEAAGKVIQTAHSFKGQKRKIYGEYRAILDDLEVLIPIFIGRIYDDTLNKLFEKIYITHKELANSSSFQHEQTSHPKSQKPSEKEQIFR